MEISSLFFIVTRKNALERKRVNSFVWFFFSAGFVTNCALDPTSLLKKMNKPLINSFHPVVKEEQDNRFFSLG
jgi:hypothetical protein